MKETILIFLLIITFSIANASEFPKELIFDMNNNNEFKFIFDQDGSLFIQIDFQKSNFLTLSIQSYDSIISETSDIIPPGKTTIIPFQKGKLFK